MKRKFFKKLSGLIKPLCAFSLLAFATQVFAQTEDAKLTASDAAAGDLFGISSSIDGSTAVVGAYMDDHDDNTHAGSAYVYDRDNGGVDTWGEIAILRSDDFDEEDWFGRSVSISGDTIIVGSPLDDDDGTASGSAYIFGRDTGGTDNWGQIAKITASDGNTGDQFGRFVAISGDFVVAGAPFEDHGGKNAVGKAYVFYRNQGGTDNWGQVAILTTSDGAANDFFGFGVAIDGDIVVVGAYQDDDGGTSTGSAYLFEKPGAGWSNMSETAKLTASDAAVADELGAAVAVSGDVVVVSARLDDDTIVNSGSAYVFVKPAGGWQNMSEDAKLTASDPGAFDLFGFSVAINGEGIIVGAYQDDSPASTAGSAYVFVKPASGWATGNEDVKLTASDAAAVDTFGWSVSISSDLGIVGSPSDDDDGAGSGSAYVFDGVCPCPWDLDSSDQVDVLDLISLLDQWGDDPGSPPDFDDDGDVDTADLLALLVNWGNCPCIDGPEPLSLEDELDEVCLTMDDWDDFEDALLNGSQAEKDNYLCWMLHYINDCNKCTCIGSSACPDDDPFGG